MGRRRRPAHALCRTAGVARSAGGPGTRDVYRGRECCGAGTGDDTTSSNRTEGCVARYDPAADYFPDKVQPRYARAFRVSYHKHYKVVRVATRDTAIGGNWAETLVLVQCGTPVPQLRGELAGARVVQVPVATLGFNEDSDLIRIKEIGFLDRVKAMGGGAVYDPELRRRWEDGRIEEIGYAYARTINIEAMVRHRPDLLILHTYGPETVDGLARARRVGLNAVPSLPWVETTQLAYAEWTKHHALFLNAEREANEWFDRVAGDYEALARRARAMPVKPTVFWGALDRNGIWQVERNGPEAALLADAGGINVLADPTAPTMVSRMSSESVLTLASRADFWFTSARRIDDPNLLVRLRPYAAVRDGCVFHYNQRVVEANNAYDWFETAVVRPDWVLADLVAVLHPELVPGWRSVFVGRTEIADR